MYHNIQSTHLPVSLYVHVVTIRIIFRLLIIVHPPAATAEAEYSELLYFLLLRQRQRQRGKSVGADAVRNISFRRRFFGLLV